jgi:pilus assembly protein CpaB
LKKLIKNRAVLGIVSILLSLFISFGMVPMFNDAVSNKVDIVRVKSDIKIGEEITKKNLEIIEVGGYNLPNEVIKNMETLIGAYAKVDLLKGDYILPSKISNESLAEYEYLENFNGNERAISISIKTFANGLSGKLERGDIVSVYVVEYGDKRETLSPIELKFVEVLAVTLGTGYDNSEVEIENSEDKELPSTVTLKVSESQAILLSDIESNGKIHLAFVYRGSEDNRSKFLDEQEELIQKQMGNELKASDYNKDAIESEAEVPKNE